MIPVITILLYKFMYTLFRIFVSSINGHKMLMLLFCSYVNVLSVKDILPVHNHKRHWFLTERFQFLK